MARWKKFSRYKTPAERDQKRLEEVKRQIGICQVALLLIHTRHNYWKDKLEERRNMYSALQKSYGKPAFWKKFSPKHRGIKFNIDSLFDDVPNDRYKDRESFHEFYFMIVSTFYENAEENFIKGYKNTYRKEDIHPQFNEIFENFESLLEELRKLEKRIERRPYREAMAPIIRKEREEKEREKENRKQRRVELLQSKADAFDGETRRQQQSVKKTIKHQLDKSPFCPYCDELLVYENSHLDHIYPVSKGGQSTVENSVLVCSTCNQKKSNQTLRNFCKLNGLNYQKIAKTLEILGKDV